jgi:thiamine pyridinylase
MGKSEVQSMLLRIRLFSLLTCAVLALTHVTSPEACGSDKPPPGQDTGPIKVTLRVALHPYIPDAGKDQHASLTKFIKTEFEKEYPHIELVIRPITVADNFYDLGLLSKWLKGDGPETYDIVEPDAIFLGELVAKGVVQPWRNTPGKQDWHPVGARAVTLNDAVYGVPHLLAGYFAVSRHKKVTNAKSISEFDQALRNLSSERRLLVGNLVGTWTMPALYLQAWTDSEDRPPAYALTKPLNQKALRGLRTLAQLGVKNGSNPCLDGTFHEETKPNLAAEEAFAKGEAEAFFGYSERLHYILSFLKKDEVLGVSSLPLGDSSVPLLYTDAFVLRMGVGPKLEDAAEAFVVFMNSPRIQEVVMMSLDTKPRAKPRYLLPATLSAFGTESVRNDRYYKGLQKILIGKVVGFPHLGILNTRKSFRDEVKAYLEK